MTADASTPPPSTPFWLKQLRRSSLVVLVAGFSLGALVGVPLFVISNLSRLWVQVDVPEHLIGRVHTDNPLLLSFDAFPGESFFATIPRIAPQLDPNVRRVQVRAEIDNPDGRLRRHAVPGLRPRT